MTNVDSGLTEKEILAYVRMKRVCNIIFTEVGGKYHLFGLSTVENSREFSCKRGKLMLSLTGLP